MTPRRRDRYTPAFPPKYLPRQGFGMVPQHAPAARPGESPEAHAERLYGLGYTMADARILAGLPAISQDNDE